MKLPRPQFLHLAAGGAALPAVSRSVWAQAYPTSFFAPCHLLRIIRARHRSAIAPA
jgi:hypothetical protein